jgi:hypothetical protein
MDVPWKIRAGTVAADADDLPAVFITYFIHAF